MGMDNYSEQLQALSDIRSMMEKSTKFVSLSGMTGIVIGLLAICSASICFWVARVYPFENLYFHEKMYEIDTIWGMRPILFIILLAGATVLSSLLIGGYYTWKKVKKNKLKLWSRSFQQMIINISIPLIVGGIFCIALALQGAWDFIAPATLIFYGLSLINGGKYTLQDVNSLGLAEIVLGCIALFVRGYGLEFWTIGFGIFHIFYGAKIYIKQG